MPVEITNINDLTETQLLESEIFLRSLIEADNPNLDLSPGTVLDQLLIKFHAIFQAQQRAGWDRYKQSNSLQEIIKNPELADTDTVDKILSNYLITRSTGAVASGQVLLILNQKTFTSVPISLTFTSNGITFRPTRAINGVTRDDLVVSSNDKLITDINAANNEYGLLVDVVATTAGVAGNVKQHTAFSVSSNLITNLTQAVAANDFDGGSDTETNQDLVGRLSSGPATKTFGARNTIKPALQANFPSVTDVAVIGAGDPEMLRDKHNTLGITTGGKVDLYVRTRSQLLNKRIDTKKAILQDATTGEWVMTLTRDESLAAYRVQIREPGTTVNDNKLITQVQRLVDTTAIPGLDFTPVMQDSEHVFTRYQTLQITFTDVENAVGATNGDSHDYEVDLLTLPEIAEINDFVINRQQRHPGGDYLVKGILPGMVAVGLKIVLGPSEEPPDTDQIKQDISDAINAIDIRTGRLSGDIIVEAVRNNISGRTRLSLPLDLRMEILAPEATISPQEAANDGSLWVFDNYELVAPNKESLSVSPKTVGFFCDPDDITIDVVATDAPII